MADELEWIWKKAALTYPKYYLSIFLEGLVITTTKFGQDSHYSG
jgi:hypothetical protein